MIDELVDLIRTVGYWRINFRPLVPLAKPLLLGECMEAVRRSTVSMRGWDFPHTNIRNDDDGGFGPGDNYTGSWVNWSGFVEFWRMYESGQFLSYIALREDTLEGQFQMGDKGSLAVENTIYTFTEIFEFGHRLAVNGIYPDGVSISLTLEGAKGRHLWLGNGARVQFFGMKRTSAERIVLETDLPPSTLSDSYREVAIEQLVRLFDRFGWNPDPAQITGIQERFYRKEFN